jgi:hypothetical protein
MVDVKQNFDAKIVEPVSKIHTTFEDTKTENEHVCQLLTSALKTKITQCLVTGVSSATGFIHASIVSQDIKKRAR